MAVDNDVAGRPKGAGSLGLALLAAILVAALGATGAYFIGFGYIAHTGRGSIWWSLAIGVAMGISGAHVMYRQGWTGRR